MKLNFKNRGSVLILSLWALSFLGIFAVNIGLRIRERAELISRLENRSALHYVTQAGIKKAISAIHLELDRNNFKLTNEGEEYLFNDPDRFSNITLGKGGSKVSYFLTGDDYPSPEQRYGVVDEERKININFADKSALSSLFENVLKCDTDKAKSLAEGIIDWRAYGQSNVVGFYSDAYYSSLEFPYEPKNSMFEIMDELMLVEGFDDKTFQALAPFITIYGDGKININTASKEVLLSLGLSQEVVDKILFVRRGNDGRDFTYDDHIFLKMFDIASEINSVVVLKEGQMKEIDSVVQRELIKLNSDFYLIKSLGKIKDYKNPLTIKCVYNVVENKEIYWREK